MIKISTLVIKIQEDKNILIEEDGPVKSSKYITQDDFFNVMSNSIRDGYETPVLPKNCIFTKKENNLQLFVLEKEAHRRDVTFYGTVYKNVGFPKLLFAILLNDQIIRSTHVVAVKNNFIIKKDTTVYKYPFSNVHPDGGCCWGGCRLPTVSEPYQLSGIPELFLAQEDNGDLYHRVNNSGLMYRELLYTLQGKDFYLQWLEPMRYYTFSEFVQHCINIY